MDDDAWNRQWNRYWNQAWNFHQDPAAASQYATAMMVTYHPSPPIGRSTAAPGPAPIPQTFNPFGGAPPSGLGSATPMGAGPGFHSALGQQTFGDYVSSLLEGMRRGGR